MYSKFTVLYSFSDSSFHRHEDKSIDFETLEEVKEFIKNLQYTFEIYGLIRFDIYKRECITSRQIEEEIENDKLFDRKQKIDSIINSLQYQIDLLNNFDLEFDIDHCANKNFITSLNYLKNLKRNLDTIKTEQKSKPFFKDHKFYKCNCKGSDCVICNPYQTNYKKEIEIVEKCKCSVSESCDYCDVPF